MQSSFSGYLLTSDSNFLVDYKAGMRITTTLFDEQQKLIRGNPQQMFLLDTIRILHLQWLSYANELIDAKRAPFVSSASERNYNELLFENQLKGQVGKKINDSISHKFSELDKIEYNIRGNHSSNLMSSIEKTHLFSLIFFTLTIIIGAATTIYIVSLISKRIKTMVRLAHSISKGNFTTLNDRHRDELTDLSSSLNIMSDSLRKNITELENRNAELDKFAYVVSHDLKAPIRGIHNVIKWIEEDLGDEFSPEAKKYLDIIPQRTKRMEDLINGLLDYARIREKTIPEKTDVNEMVSNIVESVVPRDFRILKDNLPVIVTERLKLEQVFTNLISNAVKYTPGPGREIIIGCKESDTHYEFSVKDNGIGIERQYHDKIFEMFQTLREKNEKESTGIGLAIIKKILDDRHCTIRVNSALGRGSEFVFTWPLTN